MSSKIIVSRSGPGPNVHKTVESRQEVEELGKGWEVADTGTDYDGYEIAELSQSQRDSLIGETLEAPEPNEEGKEVVELEMGRDNPQGSTFEIEPSRIPDGKLSKFFSESEIAELKQAEEREKRREAQEEAKPVSELDDDELREAWNQSRVEEQSDKSEAEKVSERWEQASRWSNSRSDVWQDMPISEGDFEESGFESPEELAEPDTADLSDEEKEAMRESWIRDRGGVWEEIAREELGLANSPEPDSLIGHTSIETYHNGNTVVVTEEGIAEVRTSQDELQSEIRENQNLESIDIKTDEGSKVVAEVEKADFFEKVAK